jgi:hypothetical protein
MCVCSLDHLDNCKSFGVFNTFKSMFKNVSSTLDHERKIQLVTLGNDHLTFGGWGGVCFSPSQIFIFIFSVLTKNVRWKMQGQIIPLSIFYVGLLFFYKICRNNYFFQQNWRIYTKKSFVKSGIYILGQIHMKLTP